MKTLHFYVTRQILAALLLTVLVFTLTLLLGNVLREVLALLLNGRATLSLAGEAIGLLIPFVLVFALPMGMLTATLLVFGRLSADQELTAARASGLSLVSLSTPVLLLGVACCGLAAWINLDLAPRCRNAYRDLIYRVGVERAAAFLEADSYIDDFEGYSVYVGGKSGRRLSNVRILQVGKDQVPVRWLHAQWAEILTDQLNVEAVLRLHEVSYYDFRELRGGFAEELDEFRLGYRKTEGRRRSTQYANLSFAELRDLLRRLESVVDLSPPPPGASLEQLQQHERRLREVRVDLITPVRVMMHRQVAFSFACIGFTLVGIPLGVRAHRRETSAGFAIAILLILVYYGFIILAQSLQTRPEYGPHLIVWLPNFLFQVVGAALLWRANRGG